MERLMMLGVVAGLMPQGQLSGVRYVIEERIYKNNPNLSDVVGIFHII